ncbi:hypothetical protein, partial [Nostoc sp. FACHB-110]|uniref:WD40 domain-containing protein n=1 Tax=Nostoc sp. FACHB-110 TaxID=2692834 RepID=UPI0019B80FE2
MGNTAEYTVAQQTAVQTTKAGIETIAFSADGQTLAAGKKNGEIVLLNPENGKEKQRLKIDTGRAVTKIA